MNDLLTDGSSNIGSGSGVPSPASESGWVGRLLFEVFSFRESDVVPSPDERSLSFWVGGAAEHEEQNSPDLPTSSHCLSVQEQDVVLGCTRRT